jgi:hypothetical protein
MKDGIEKDEEMKLRIMRKYVAFLLREVVQAEARF